MIGLLLAVTAAGCGRNSGAGLPISGTVRRGGASVTVDGVLTLLPERSNSAPTVSTPIEGGHYAFDRQSGPRPGRYQALVQLFDLDSESATDGATAKLGPLTPQAANEVRMAVEVTSREPWVLDLEVPGAEDSVPAHAAPASP